MNKAMVVDDSRATRLILAGTLAESGFEVEQAVNGRDALDRMEQDGESLRLVLVDWNMPEMTGLEFIQAVRAREEFDHVRLCMVSTETEIDQMSLALASGADEYLMKPFTHEAVCDKLRLLGMLE